MMHLERLACHGTAMATSRCGPGPRGCSTRCGYFLHRTKRTDMALHEGCAAKALNGTGQATWPDQHKDTPEKNERRPFSRRLVINRDALMHSDTL